MLNTSSTCYDVFCQVTFAIEAYYPPAFIVYLALLCSRAIGVDSAKRKTLLFEALETQKFRREGGTQIAYHSQCGGGNFIK